MIHKKTVRRWLSAGLLAACCATLGGTAFASTDFPRKPVSIVVPFAAGGNLDMTARIVADKLGNVLGKQVLVLNRPGAGTAVGVRFVASAPADGYTLLLSSGSAYGFMHLLLPDFDLGLKDFTPIASVASNPSAIVVSTTMKAKTLQELVEYVQANPGTVSFCSTGVNGLNHLQLEMFKRLVKKKTGKDFLVTHVPYNGVAPALIAVQRHDVQACMLPYTSLLKTLNGKSLHILAIQRKAPMPSIPDVPTTGAQGYPEMDGNDAFENIEAPKGTPAAVVAKLEAALRQTMQDPVVRQKLQKLDIEPIFMSSQETMSWLKKDVAKFSAIIEDAGLATAAH